MLFEDLPDFALHLIFLECDAEEIDKIEITNKKCYNIVKRNRLHYRKKKLRSLSIRKTEDAGSKVILRGYDRKEKNKTLVGSLNDAISSWEPEYLISYDHEELANMNVLWWKNIRLIILYDIIDYRRYVLHFDRLTQIILQCDLPKNMSEILQCMETKNLLCLSVAGNGELECTSDDMRKIGRLSCEMDYLNLENFSESSNVSIDSVLDMIEVGSFCSSARLHISRIQGIENMEKCKKERKWISEYAKEETRLDIKSNINNHWYLIKWDK